MEDAEMNTNDIRNTIEEKLAEEQNTGSYSALLRSNLDETQSQALFDFTSAYLRVTPDLIDQVYNTASKANCLAMFQPIFNALFNYWGEEYDFIPDHIGIAGICDDAYLSMSLMQLVANSPVSGTNQVLMQGVNTDLQKQNNVMAMLLGSTVASQLDAVVTQQYQSIYIQETLTNILNAAGMNTLFGASALNYMHSSLEQSRIDDQVNRQLGAMGIF